MVTKGNVVADFPHKVSAVETGDYSYHYSRPFGFSDVELLAALDKCELTAEERAKVIADCHITESAASSDSSSGTDNE